MAEALKSSSEVPSLDLPVDEFAQPVRPAGRGGPLVAMIDFESSSLDQPVLKSLSQALWARLDAMPNIAVYQRNPVRRWLIRHDLFPFTPYMPPVSPDKITTFLKADYLLTGQIERIDSVFNLELNLYSARAKRTILKDIKVQQAELEDLVDSFSSLNMQIIQAIQANEAELREHGPAPTAAPPAVEIAAPAEPAKVIPSPTPTPKPKPRRPRPAVATQGTTATAQANTATTGTGAKILRNDDQPFQGPKSPRTTPSPTPTPAPAPRLTPRPTATLTPTPTPKPTPAAQATPRPTPAPTAQATPRPAPSPAPQVTPAPEPAPEAPPNIPGAKATRLMPKGTPKTEPAATPSPTPASTPAATPKPSPTASPTPAPASNPAEPSAADIARAQVLYQEAMTPGIAPAQRLQKLEQAAELAPGHVAYQQPLALEYYTQGRHENAITQIDKALRAMPGNSMLLTIKGSSLFELGRFGEAAQAQEEALRRDPKNFWASFNLALALTQQHSDQAPAAWRNFLAFSDNPSVPRELLDRARQYLAAVTPAPPGK